MSDLSEVPAEPKHEAMRLAMLEVVAEYSVTMPAVELSAMVGYLAGQLAAGLDFSAGLAKGVEMVVSNVRLGYDEAMPRMRAEAAKLMN